MASYLEDYTEKLGTVTIDTNRYLRHIRELDKRVEELQKELADMQKNLVEKVKAQKDKRPDQKAIEEEYERIVEKEKLCYGMALEKVKVSEQLHELVTESAQKLENELARLKTELRKNTNITDEERDERENALKKKKLKSDSKMMQKLERVGNTKEWLYDRTEPRYCYCGGFSEGEMVECENVFCEKEWFHRICVPDKSLPDVWICDDCKKQKEKMRSSNLRFYI